MPAPTVSIEFLIGMVKALPIDPEDMTTLVVSLQRYQEALSDAQEVVAAKCTEVLEEMDEHNSKDDPDQSLTQAEYDAWIEIAACFGESSPVPEWYEEMYPGNEPGEWFVE